MILHLQKSGLTKSQFKPKTQKTIYILRKTASNSCSHLLKETFNEVSFEK